MSRRAVYDAMIFLQWAALPAGRQHGTINALVNGSIRLCLSAPLLEEVRDLLSRPNIRAKSQHLTDARVASVLTAAAKYSDWFQHVPNVFSLSSHPDDDHLFNLAIEAKAQYLVTWERRILDLQKRTTPEAQRLFQLAPALSIATPPDFLQHLNQGSP